MGGEGITLAGLQLHSHALTAMDIREIYKLGATLSELSLLPDLPVADWGANH